MRFIAIDKCDYSQLTNKLLLHSDFVFTYDYELDSYDVIKNRNDSKILLNIKWPECMSLMQKYYELNKRKHNNVGSMQNDR